MKNYIYALFACCIVLYATPLQAANFSSLISGNWNAAGTWTLTSGSDADGIPDADDNVTIAGNHTITLDIAPTIATLNMTAGLRWQPF